MHWSGPNYGSMTQPVHTVLARATRAQPYYMYIWHLLVYIVPPPFHLHPSGGGQVCTDILAFPRSMRPESVRQGRLNQRRLSQEFNIDIGQTAVFRVVLALYFYAPHMAQQPVSSAYTMTSPNCTADSRHLISKQQYAFSRKRRGFHACTKEDNAIVNQRLDHAIVKFTPATCARAHATGNKRGRPKRFGKMPQIMMKSPIPGSILRRVDALRVPHGSERLKDRTRRHLDYIAGLGTSTVMRQQQPQRRR